MNNYAVCQPSTFRGIIQVAALSALPFVAQSHALASDLRNYFPVQERSTGQVTQILPSSPVADTDLLGAMAACHQYLVESQVSLDPDISKILYDNIWDLYIED